MALVKIAGGVVDSGVQFPEADLREMRAVTASCSCTAGLEIREGNVITQFHTYQMHAFGSMNIVIWKPVPQSY